MISRYFRIVYFFSNFWKVKREFFENEKCHWLAAPKEESVLCV